MLPQYTINRSVYCIFLSIKRKRKKGKKDKKKYRRSNNNNNNYNNYNKGIILSTRNTMK